MQGSDPVRMPLYATSPPSGNILDIRSSETAPPWYSTPFFRWIAAAAILSGVVTATVLIGLLLFLRSQSIISGERVLSAFAQLANEQTTSTIQNVDATLQASAEAVSVAEGNGSNNGTINVQLRGLLDGRPFLRAITLLTPNEMAAQ